MVTQARELPLPKQEWLGDDYEDDDEEEGGEGEEGWDDWDSDGDDTAGRSGGGLLYLFCCARFDSEGSLFELCGFEHRFDFRKVVRELGLDFYGCINFVRSKVADNECWSCGQSFASNSELCSHLHAAETCDANLYEASCQ